MKAIIVSKNQTLEILRRNLHKHTEEFNTAYAGYVAALVDRLAELTKDATAAINAIAGGGDVKQIRTDLNNSIRLSEPTSHAESYERAIRMLEMSVEDEIELEVREFANYIDDEWDWKDNFKRVSSSYSS